MISTRGGAGSRSSSWAFGVYWLLTQVFRIFAGV